MANEANIADQMRTKRKARGPGLTAARLHAATVSEDEVPEDIFRYWLARGVTAYTYFARGDRTGRIKIGKSKDPCRRVGELPWVQNGEPATLLCTLRGEHFEKAYHQKFAAHLDGCEWFHPHPDILDEVERLQKGARHG